MNSNTTKSNFVPLRVFQHLSGLSDALLVSLLDSGSLPASLLENGGVVIDLNQVSVQSLLAQAFKTLAAPPAHEVPILREELRSTLAQFLDEVVSEALLKLLLEERIEDREKGSSGEDSSS